MKLSTFARRAGICYKTAWRWWKNGKIKGYQTETGTVIIPEEVTEQPGQEKVVVVSTRVSANENRPTLDSQAERLCASCAARGWKVVNVVKEVGSGVNDGRRKLLALLADPTVTVIVVEHKDRLTRFGFIYYVDTCQEATHLPVPFMKPTQTRIGPTALLEPLRECSLVGQEQRSQIQTCPHNTYIETLLAMQGRSIEVVNVTENPIEDIIADFVSMLYSFCAKLYGQRRAKRKTEKIVQDLNVKAEQKTPQEEVREKSA